MTRLWLVRHGPTHAKGMVGWTDLAADLSDRAALARLDAFLPRQAIVVSSDLCRATATADAIGPGRRRLPHAPGLREFHFGAWEGLTFDQVSDRWPDLSRRYWEEPGEATPPGGESWVAGAGRMSATVDDLIAGHPQTDLIVVAHFGTILSQYARAAGLTPYQALGQQIDNLSVTCIALGPTPGVHLVNHIA